MPYTKMGDKDLGEYANDMIAVFIAQPGNSHYSYEEARKRLLEKMDARIAESEARALEWRSKKEGLEGKMANSESDKPSKGTRKTPTSGRKIVTEKQRVTAAKARKKGDDTDPA